METKMETTPFRRADIPPFPANLVTVLTFGPSCFHRISRVPTVTGIGAVFTAILITVVTLGPLSFCRASVTGIGVALVLYKSSIQP